MKGLSWSSVRGNILERRVRGQLRKYGLADPVRARELIEFMRTQTPDSAREEARYKGDFKPWWVHMWGQRGVLWHKRVFPVLAVQENNTARLELLENVVAQLVKIEGVGQARRDQIHYGLVGETWRVGCPDRLDEKLPGLPMRRFWPKNWQVDYAD